MQKKKGFTLIELLVVIAIIGILSAIGLVSLNGAREKARDAQRISDLAQIRTALVLYFDDNDSAYPGVAVINESDAFVDPADTACNAGIDLCDSIVTEYLNRMPVPPNAAGTGVCAIDSYYYTANGIAANDSSDWALWTRLEAINCSELYVINQSGNAAKYDDANDVTTLADVQCNTAASTENACANPPTSN